MKSFFVLWIVSIAWTAVIASGKVDTSLRNEKEKFRETKVLQVGDKVPNVTVKNIYNYHSKSIRLSDFRGKLVILDFWATFCGSCVKGFPKMNMLQSKFNSQLQVLLVNSSSGDNEKKVYNFFEKRLVATGEKNDLPYILQDSILPSLFPHRFIPHFVWIDKKGVVLAITSSEEVTEENIQKILAGENVSLHQKRDLLDFKEQSPLFVNGNGGDGSVFESRSIFTKLIEGIGSVSGINTNADGKVSRFYMYNDYPFMMLKAAYGSMMEFPSNRTIIDLEANKKALLSLDDNSLNFSNLYCYELIVPPTSMPGLLKYMQEDLFRMFQLRVLNEKRKLSCIVLRDSAYKKGGIPRPNKTNLGEQVKNKPIIYSIQDVVALLNSRSAIPFLDETGITTELLFDDNSELLEEDEIITKLREVGIAFIEEEKWIDVMIITDK